jgi:CubicO group peptidase (beta-lactamase class C family)
LKEKEMMLFHSMKRGDALRGVACILTNTVLISVCSLASAQTDRKPAANVKDGFLKDGLDRLHTVIQQNVDEHEIAGAVTLLARHGKVVDLRAYGQKDLSTGSRMTEDTIFRDYSMTKPVTAVAMMILFEQGKWLPSDPISKFVPEFANLKVFRGVGPDGEIFLDDPIHQPTMQELMDHTAGFTYGFFGSTAVDKLYREANLFQSPDLHEMVVRISHLPLLFQPGTEWNYSVGMDIEGYIIEKLSGQSLPEFMKQHIFNPLKMVDSGFFVSEVKQSRFATLYIEDKAGKLIPAPSVMTTAFMKEPTAASGGGGMVSTISDYFRFAQMLLNHGELDGARIVSPASVKLMTTNHLPDSFLTGKYGIAFQHLRPGLGYGYNVAVEFDPAAAGLTDGAGTFFWDGLAGTWFWIDPTNDVVFIGMIQRIIGPLSPNLQYQTRAVVYGAMTEPPH